jgi:hypothetical protein
MTCPIQVRNVRDYPKVALRLNEFVRMTSGSYSAFIIMLYLIYSLSIHKRTL